MVRSLEVTQIYPHEAVDVKDMKTGVTFKVNGQCLKHYWGAHVNQDKRADMYLCFLDGSKGVGLSTFEVT
ncbi:hypothetical protein EPI10_005796 [Gossypium australe]|uniref:Uncharacterized protein n=1 Tax=Gossypium australe TaxID=47621 RepID=A0A5B6WRV0_9ROSI|nr:hypothetical protein EPI10_005796 [Gossypium australe]